MNYNHLHYFHVVAETGSLSAAARELGVTVPTVSEQIKQLETTMGRKLFNRTGSGLRLTEAGRLAQQHTSIMFRESQRMLDRLDQNAQADRQLLEVGVASTVSRSFAADYFLALFELEEAFVRIQSGEETHLLHSLLMHEIDLLVTDQAIADPDDRGIVCEVVHQPKMVAIGSKEIADSIDTFPFDLAKVPLVHYTKSSRYRWEIDQCFRSHGVMPNIIGEVSDIGIMRAVAEQGVAAAILPLSAVRDGKNRCEVLGDLSSEIRSDVFVAYKSEDPSDFIRAAVEALKAGPSQRGDP